MEAQESTLAIVIPAAYLATLPFAVSKPASAPTAKLGEPIVAETSTIGDGFKPKAAVKVA